MGGLVRVIDNVTRFETEKDVDLLVSGGASLATEIKITNLDITTANTEFNLVLQANLKQLIIRNRSRAEMKIAFIVGESGSNYSSIPIGTTLSLTDINFNDKILYVQASIISIVEITELYV